MTVTVIFAYLVSKLFFVTLLLCFVSWDWLTNPASMGVFPSFFVFWQDSSSGRHWQEMRQKKGGRQTILLSHRPMPFSLTPAHARQSSAVNLAPDEQSPPLGSGSDSCLQAGISVASCYKSLNCSYSYALSVQSFITCVNNFLY